MNAIVSDKTVRWRFKGWRRGLAGVALVASCSLAVLGAFGGSVAYCKGEAEAIHEYAEIGLIRVTHPKLYVFLGCEKLYSTGQ
jgi:hypothetical protein